MFENLRVAGVNTSHPEHIKEFIGYMMDEGNVVVTYTTSNEYVHNFRESIGDKNIKTIVIVFINKGERND